MMNRRKLGNFLLRISLGLIFLYTGVGKVFLGEKVPAIDRIITFLSVENASLALGVVELIIGVLLVIGLWTRVAGWAAAILLACFIIAGSLFGLFQQAGLFKDIGLLGSALYLGLVGARSHAIDTRTFRAEEA